MIQILRRAIGAFHEEDAIRESSFGNEFVCVLPAAAAIDEELVVEK